MQLGLCLVGATLKKKTCPLLLYLSCQGLRSTSKSCSKRDEVQMATRPQLQFSLVQTILKQTFCQIHLPKLTENMVKNAQYPSEHPTKPPLNQKNHVPRVVFPSPRRYSPMGFHPAPSAKAPWASLPVRALASAAHRGRGPPKWLEDQVAGQSKDPCKQKSCFFTATKDRLMNKHTLNTPFFYD